MNMELKNAVEGERWTGTEFGGLEPGRGILDCRGLELEGVIVKLGGALRLVYMGKDDPLFKGITSLETIGMRWRKTHNADGSEYCNE